MHGLSPMGLIFGYRAQSYSEYLCSPARKIFTMGNERPEKVERDSMSLSLWTWVP